MTRKTGLIVLLSFAFLILFVAPIAYVMTLKYKPVYTEQVVGKTR